jgi:hypothetical protein
MISSEFRLPKPPTKNADRDTGFGTNQLSQLSYGFYDKDQEDIMGMKMNYTLTAEYDTPATTAAESINSEVFPQAVNSTLIKWTRGSVDSASSTEAQVGSVNGSYAATVP